MGADRDQRFARRGRPRPDALAIDAHYGSRLLRIDGDASNRVEITISDLGLRQGSARSSGDGANGGAVLLGQAGLALHRMHVGETIAENAGAAIYVDGGTLRVEDSLIANNRAGPASGAATGLGGGIAAQYAAVTIARSHVGNNSAGRGGGLSRVFGSVAEIVDSVFNANEAQQGTAGAVYAYDTGGLRIRSARPRS